MSQQVQPIDSFQDISDSTPAPEDTDKATYLRFTFVRQNFVFVTLTVVFALLLAGFFIVVKAYTATFLNLLSWRTITYLGILYILILLLCIRANVVDVLKAMRGNVRRRPFERKSNFASKTKETLYELFDSNGKWYLNRLFGGEVLEMAYQIWNFTYFRCVIKSSYLAVYSLLMSVECVAVCMNMLPFDQPIGVHNKNRAILLDICMEVFSSAYPLMVLFYGQGIPIAETEFMQIVLFPALMLMMKLRTTWNDQVILMVDKQRVYDLVMGAKNDKETKKRRRTSFAARETAVADIQNQYLTRRYRVGVFGFSLFAFCVYFYSGVMLSGYSFFHTYKETMQYCLADVPLCTNGVIPENNCASLRLLKTTYEDHQRFFEESISMNALQVVKISGVRDVSQLSVTPWQRLKVFWIFNSPIRKFDIDVSSYENLFQVRFFNLSNLTHIHKSMISTTSFELRVQQCPQLVFPSVQNPLLRVLILSSLKSVDVTDWDAPSLIMIMLMNVNLTTLPSMGNLVSLNVAMNPHLHMKTTPIVQWYIDMRHNHISDAVVKEYQHVPFKYGSGVSCPTAWNCTGFCKPTCIGYSSTVCLPSCMGGSCGVPAPCAAEFNDL